MERSTTSLNGRGSVVVEKELITDPVVIENELVDTGTTGEINHQTSVLTPEQKTHPVEEAQGDTEQPIEPPKNKQKRKLPKALILAGLGVGAIASGIAGYHWWQYASVHVSTDDAYIRGNVHPVSSRINGTVASVLVDDNQQVKKGLLVKLDPSDYQVQSQQSQAALEAAQRQANAARSNINYASKNAQGNITQAQGNISNAQAAVATAGAAVKEAQAEIPAAGAQVAQANANLQNLEVDYKRYQNLYQSGAIARQQLDSARTAYQVAVAEKNTAVQGVAQAEAKLAQAQQSVAEAQAKFAASKGGLVQAQAGNAQTEVNRSQYQAAKAAIAQAQAQLNNSKLQLSLHEHCCSLYRSRR